MNNRAPLNNIVFICGCPRSGTSWTWGLLNSLHRTKPLLIEDFPGIKTNFSISKMKTEQGFSTTETTIFHSNLTDKQIVDGIRKKSQKYKGYTLIEKTPSNGLSLDRITSLFPEAKVVYLVRDPRAVINSMLRTQFSNGKRIVNSTEDGVALYQKYESALESYKDYKNLIVVRYEDLHQNPHSTLEALFGFCNIQSSKKEISETIHANSKKSQTLSSNDFRKGEVDSYRQELSTLQILQISFHLRKTMKEYGYLSWPQQKIFQRYFLKNKNS